MSPHAVPLLDSEQQAEGVVRGCNSGVNAQSLFDGCQPTNKSLLQPTEDGDMHDIICCGFGPASLAIVIALHDALEKEEFSTIDGQGPKVCLLERQDRFAWHAGMLLEGAKMQISFIKDMATLRNPRSSFTFLNYLHKKDRLVQFANLATFLPQRVEFEDYLRWCAEWFHDVAHYSQEVLEVRPEKSWRGTQQIDSFAVVSRNTRTGVITSRRTKHVILAAGGRPNIPRVFPKKHPRLLHSSQYACQIANLLPNRQASYNVAVVGGGQSAAEIFNNLQSKYPNSQTRLIVKGPALRPSDDSPFVNEIFDPIRVEPFFRQSPQTRTKINHHNRATNYGVVRLELLEHIYETMYMQRIKQPDEEQWQHHILNSSNIVGVDAGDKSVLRLHIEQADRLLPQEFDAVILATGYSRDMHEEFLAPARYLMPGGDAPEKVWEVERDYKVVTEEGMVSDDAGIYLQGACESSHGLADSLLSILAVRGGEIVQSVFGDSLTNGAKIGNLDAIIGEPNLAVKSPTL